MKDEGGVRPEKPFKKKIPDSFEGVPLRTIIFLVIVVVCGGYLATGFYQVNLGSVALVTRLGSFFKVETEGWHYRLPWPIDEVYICDTSVVHQLNMDRGRGVSQTITGDRNLVDVSYMVQWRVSDSEKFLFHLADHQGCIRLTADSCMRDAINNIDIDDALSEGRSSIELAVKENMQRILDSYELGILIQNVTLRKLDPPQEVADAFYDVEKAWADHHYSVNRGEAFRNEALPLARAQAETFIQDAHTEAYALRKDAEGEVSMFESLTQSMQADQHKGADTFLVYETLEGVLKDQEIVLLDESLPQSVLPILPSGSRSEKEEKEQGGHRAPH